jgi:hypothetical protein
LNERNRGPLGHGGAFGGIATLGPVADGHDPFPACDICGRTILKGEQIHEYLTAQRQRIRVCVLCRSRAESSGWIPVSMEHTIAEEEPKRSRGHALRKRLSDAASRARSTGRAKRRGAGERAESGEDEHSFEDFGPVTDEAIPTQRVPQAEAARGADESSAAEPAPPQPAPKRSGPRKQAGPRAERQPRAKVAKQGTKSDAGSPRPRRKSPAKRGPEALMRRAVERFNSSEERRKVAGLSRSLGEPEAGVRPDPRRQLALVTIAWELSWYQWEVGADGDEDEPVREVAKGGEISELAEDARTWNAAVDEDGTLRLRSTAERKQAAAKEA